MSTSEKPERAWDVFISYATEDGSTVAEPLALLLQRMGIRIWLDSWEIQVGDGIRKSIDEGLRKCRFGVLILSKSYLSRYWPTGELDALIALEAGKKLFILPVLHGITVEELLASSPLLAARRAADTDRGIEQVAVAINDAVKYRLYTLGDEEISPVPRLARILHDRHHPSVIRDFMLQHPQLLFDLIGWGDEKDHIFAVGSDEILISSFAPSLRAFMNNIVWLYPTEPAGFPATVEAAIEKRLLEAKSPEIDLSKFKHLRGGVESPRGDRNARRILLGRRVGLSEDDSKRMSDFNDRHSGFDNRVTIRSYDHLLDAVLAAREGHFP